MQSALLTPTVEKKNVRPAPPELRILTVVRERQFTRVLRAFVLSGLVFLLLPGTFLGVWNLISISSHHALAGLSPAWLQAHGHAQLFGWLGSFIMGIGFYSVPAGRRVRLTRAWACWGLWLTGVTMRWCTGVYGHYWRVLLPLSALLELSAFLIFFHALRGHRREDVSSSPNSTPAWIHAVLLGTFGFGTALLANAVATFVVALRGVDRAMPATFNQRWLTLVIWGFVVPTVLGFTARWVPVFIGTPGPRERQLRYALWSMVGGIGFATIGWTTAAESILFVAAVLAILGLNLFAVSQRPAKTRGIHPSMPLFIRIAYAWLLIASVLGIFAALLDRHNGYWGSSRHALTVGFLATMVFSIGPRVLPHFSGVKSLFSTRWMFAALLLLNVGCTMRVVAEICAYEYSIVFAWRVLPVSAVTELLAVTVFAANIQLTIALSPSAFVGAGRELAEF